MTGDEHPIVLFDGVCKFCNRMVNFAIRNDPKKKLRFAPLQSATGQRLKVQYGVAPEVNTVVLIENGKAYTYANAAIRVCRHLRWPVRMLYAYILVPPFISQAFYKWFARRRYRWFGKLDTCMIPTPGVRDRFLD